MFRSDPAGIAYATAAVAFAVVAAVTWRRRAHNTSVAAALMLVMVGACWWSLSDAVAVSAVDETLAAVAWLAAFPGLSVTVAAFVCLAVSIARPQWTPGRRVVLGLLVHPVLITVAAATNPWHELVYTGPGARVLTGSADWAYGPVFWVHSAISYLALSGGVVLVAIAWWTAPRAFRAQRLSVLVAVLVPVALNAVNLAGGLPIEIDPTPMGLAVTGTVVAFAVFRQHLFTFTPVARALILEQIGDAIVAVSPAGRILDLNPAAAELVRRMRRGAVDPVGSPARDVLGPDLADPRHGGEIDVELDGVPAVLQVRSSELADRKGRALGTVLVARDVTAVKAQSRRLEEANARLTEQVRTIEGLRADLAEVASRDPLTGLRNRRHMVDRFAAQLAEAARRGEPLAVVLLDVDRFKTINDVHGHLTGDAVLVEIARRLEQAAPPGALVARWGGEEFFVAIPGADAAAGLAFAESVRARLHGDGVVVDGAVVPCTLSGGVAAYPGGGTTTTELFRAADELLYAAKTSGRNQVRTGPPAGPRAPAPVAARADGLVTPVRVAGPLGSGAGDRH